MDYRKHSRIIQGLCLLGLIASSHAAEQRDIGLTPSEGYSLTVGLEYESGDYGTSATTDLWRVPVGIDYVKGPFSAGVNTAYLSAKSTGAITISNMTHMTSVSTSSSSVRSASGIGDINLYASYQLPADTSSDFIYHVTGRLKLGTADEKKGLGTGENDYAVEGGLLTAYDKFYVFANLGYQVTGDSATVNYDNVWYANAGATYPMTKARSVGAMLEVSQAATPGFDSPAQLTLFLNQKLDTQRQLYFYLLLGLSNGSPDSGVGVNMTVAL
jgi:hypothetical protein